MAKFRQNHARSGNATSSTMIRIVAFLIILLVSLYLGFQLVTKTNDSDSSKNIYEVPLSNDKGSLYYLPTGGKGEIIEHQSYVLSYVENYEQAEWVAYELTKEQLIKPNLPREKWFDPDPKVRSGSAVHADYIRSGYTRGHLIPAADRSFHKDFQKETFYMSNISPQKRNFNGGVWNELENLIRDWAYKNNRLLIITGPVLDSSIDEFIGKNRVGVPQMFYKVILDIDEPEIKGIGFLLKNETTDNPLDNFMVSIDSIEVVTGLNFFNQLLDPELERNLESTFDPSLWPLDSELYQKRINQWNSR